MYELKILISFAALLAGFGTLYAFISYLRHRRMPRMFQFASAMLLGFCLTGLCAAAAGFYMLWKMNAMSPLTIGIVAIPTTIFAVLAILALANMRASHRA